MCVCVCRFVCMCVCVYNVHTYVYVCTNVYMYVRTYIHTHMHTYVRTYDCVYICICMYLIMNKRSRKQSANLILCPKTALSITPMSNLASNPDFGLAVGTKFRPLFSSDFSTDVRRLVLLPVRLTMLVPNPKSGWTLPFPGLSLN